jgi:hypothetical protein
VQRPASPEHPHQRHGLRGHHDKIKNDPKHTIVTLPEAERRRWDAAMEKVIAEWRKADPVNDKLWQAYQKVLGEVRADLKSGR